MSNRELNDWLQTEQGKYVTSWELERVNSLVSDAFGFNALQMGLPQLDFLAENRIPLRAKLGEADAPAPVGVYCDLPALPIASGSIDLVVLAHAMEFHPHPHQLLREVERILIAEGKVVIVGFNPFSLWGMKRRFRGRDQDDEAEGGPWSGRYISLPRLKDWLALLGFEIDRGHFGRYAPPFKDPRWIKRWSWIEKAGDRWWPVAGGVYVIRAVKRVHGLRLIKPKWSAIGQTRKALNPVARKEHGNV